MEQETDTKKKLVKAIVWIVVIVALMATTHIIINSFDGLEFFKQLHGG